MQMKTSVEQAIYAVAILALLPEKAVLPGDAISEQLKTSPSYSQKLLRRLVREGLIHSVPGAKGGFKLMRKPEEITIYDIYIAMEGHQAFYTPSGIFDDLLEAEEDYDCLLVSFMDEAEVAWKAVLKKQTIAKLVTELEQSKFQERVQKIKQIMAERMVM